MDETLVILSSLAMDLKRYALGLHRKSYQMADRFHEEALKRKQELSIHTLHPTIIPIIRKIDALGSVDEDRRAEDALYLSIRIQNFVTKSCLIEK